LMKTAQKKGNIDMKKTLSSPISPYTSMAQGRTQSTAKGTTCRKTREKDGFTDFRSDENKRKSKTDDLPATSEFVVTGADLKNEV
jgi:hypothetical protein